MYIWSNCEVSIPVILMTEPDFFCHGKLKRSALKYT